MRALSPQGRTYKTLEIPFGSVVIIVTKPEREFDERPFMKDIQAKLKLPPIVIPATELETMEDGELEIVVGSANRLVFTAGVIDKNPPVLDVLREKAKKHKRRIYAKRAVLDRLKLS